MLTLICAVVGVKGSAFPVDIDENKLVGHLKYEIKRKKMYEFPANGLQLFLTKATDDKGGIQWLSDESEAALDLEKGIIHRDIRTLINEEQMEVTKALGHWLFEKNKVPQPSTDQIHVLVKLPEDFTPNKRPRLASTPQDVQEVTMLDEVPQIDINSDNKYATLPAGLLNACGLFSRRDLMLYRRPWVNNLWTYLENDVVKDNKRPYVVGPTGTGKSACTLGFAASLDRQVWSVIWIHLAEDCTCLVMKTKEFWEFSNLAEFVLPRVADEKLFVFVDGYKNCVAHETFVPIWRSTLHKDKDRFVICSSVAALGKRNEVDDKRKKYESYSMYSWTEEEYLDAIIDDTFYTTVVDKLDATSDWCKVNTEDGSDEESETKGDGGEVDESEKDLALKLKFYYAGGSRRFMFEFTTGEIKQL